ncbi:MAG: hypothetical protein J7L57_06690 [Deltaproteobacteria bacterium]|nr:hypothetical protein [Candidatus Tharpella sp.]
MKSPDIVEKTIVSAISECESHLSRLTRSKQLLDQFMPLTTDSLKDASDERIEHLDQFIYRFTKLQDSMGTRLLPSLHSFFENSSQPMPFLDKLNRLEQLGILTSVENWQFFRNLRNNLAHDYLESVDQTVLTLNILYDKWPHLQELYIQARNYYRSRIRV